MSFTGALKRLLSRRSSHRRLQAASTLRTLDRASRSVVESLEGRQMLTATPVYPQIVVQGGTTPVNIAYQDSTPATADGTDFGTVDTKKSVVETFTIKNTGAGTLNLTAFNHVQVTGANAADFVVTAQPAALLAPNARTTFSVKFAPTTNAAEHAAISINNDTDGEDPYTFSVQGTGTSASRGQVIGLASKIINAGDTTLTAADGTNFGSTESASGSVSETFTLKNLGSATMNLSGAKVTVSGADAAAFTVTTPPPATIASGAQATFVVKFAPGTQGVKNATINVLSDDPTTPTYHFNVTGTGVNAAVINLSGTGNTAIATGATTTSTSNGTDFGTADLVMTTVTNTFKIANPGASALTLSGSPIVSISGTGKTAFTVVTQPSGSVAAGGNVTFQIKFAPGSVGVKTALITIANSAGGAAHPYTFTVTGNAVSVPQLDVQGGSPAVDLTAAQTATSTTDGTDFGNGDITAGGATHVFSLRNLGSAALSNLNVTIAGADASQFSLVTPPAAASLAGRATSNPAALPAPRAVAAVASTGRHYHTSTKHHFHTGTVAHPTVSTGAVPAETFAIKFAPTDDTVATKNAVVTVHSNDPTVPAYSFNVTGNADSVSDLAVSDSTGTHAIATGDVTPLTTDGTDFGSADTTQSVTRTFTLANLGSAVLNQGSATVVGDSDFTVTTDYGSTIASGATDHVTITFNPLSAGVKTGVVSIATDDPNSPYTFTVKGTGLSAPVEQVQGGTTPTTIASGDTTPATVDGTDFGTAELNFGSVTQTFVLNNLGSGAMNITHVTVTGANHGDFTVINPQPTTPVAATNGTTNLLIKFRPTAVGLRTAIITVQTNDPANPNYTFTVQGTAVRAPVMQILGKANTIIATGDVTTASADGTDYGSTDAAFPVTHTFSIKNIGSDALDLSGSPTIAVSGDNPSDFVVTAHPRVSTAAGSTTTFDVKFTPSTTAAEDAIVTIASDDAATPYTFEVGGTGIATPVITVKGGSAGTTTIVTGDTTPQPADGTDFGQAIINSGSASDQFVITNSGSADLNLTGTPTIAISGTNAGDFSVIAAPVSPVTAGGSTTGFIVKFAPTAAGTRTATITIASDDPHTPSYTFSVKGTGITAPIMAVQSNGTPIVNGETTPDTSNNTDFGDTELANGFVTQTFTIRDTGSAALNLSGTPIVRVTGANTADFTVVTQPAATIAAGANLTFQIKFKPTAAGQRNATVSIASNDLTTTPYTFAITGNAVVQPVLSVTGTPGHILTMGQTATSAADGTDFGSAVSFTGVVDKTFTIKNTGSSALHLNLNDLVDISGPDAADFTLKTAPASTTLAAGASTTFTLEFAPTNNAAENATVSIASDDPNGTFTFNIKGTGTAS